MEIKHAFKEKILEPEAVFRYFTDICNIPHGSGNVQKISDYCVNFAKKHGLRYRQDENYNVIIWKEAAKGFENRPTVILQGHLDMVSVKDAGCKKNLEKDGLDLAVEGDFLYANQTSLGADDGIAIAYALAILASDTIGHPPLEAVFTVDEEIGMLGAAALDLSDVNGRIMMNMDSEEEGTFLAGCAGGATVICSLPVGRKKAEGILCDLHIDGLTGGHSGTEIICQRANANVLLGRLLKDLSGEIHYRIVSVSGGEKDNAIAKQASATVLVEAEDAVLVAQKAAALEDILKKEYAATDPNLAIHVSVDKKKREAEVYTKKSAKKLLLALLMLPYGVLKMSNDIQGLVQTSLNLGILKEEDNDVKLCYSVRSAVRSEKEFLIERLMALTEYLDGQCEIMGEYPAWEYQKESALREKMVEVYQRRYGKMPVVETIHAGVECGIIADKLPGLDCVSFGPDIFDIHTTQEKLSISSVKRTWELIVSVLAEI